MTAPSPDTSGDPDHDGTAPRGDVPEVGAPGIEAPGVDLAALDAAHAARLTGIDRVVPAPGPLTGLLAPPEAVGADDAAGGAGTAAADARELVTVRLPDGSCAAGVASTSRVDPATFAATFRALHEHRLRARVAGPDVTGAFGALLDRWVGGVRDGAGTGPVRAPDDGRDTVLAVTWPSRDVEVVAALVARGFRPTSTIAVRRPGRGAGQGAARRDAAPAASGSPSGHDGPRAARGGRATTGVVVRDAGPDDLDTVVAQHLAEITYDDLTGAAHLRAQTRSVLEGEVAAALARPGSTVLLAETGGEVVGVVAIDSPALSGWMSGTVTDAPVAYLVLLHVRAGARGRGVGSLLVDAALERVRPELGASGAVVLHHGALNPLSAPFWALHGFRPVHTSWELPVTRTT